MPAQSFRPVIWLLGIALASGSGLGCAFGPRAIEKTHGLYGSAVERVDEEQLLRNIVRLRYVESPAELDITAIAAQYELEAGGEVQPFFASEGVTGPFFQTFTRFLPVVSVSGANRPTVSMVPQSDASSVLQFLTPIRAETLVFLTQAGWPVASVLGIWVERLNGVPNGTTTVGSALDLPADGVRFARAVALLQELHDQELTMVRSEIRFTDRSGPLPASAVTATALVEAAKAGFEYRPRTDGTWTLAVQEPQLVLEVNPLGQASPELAELTSILNLAPGQAQYPIELAAAVSDPAKNPHPPSTTLRVTPRSTAQALFFLANGVEVPPYHITSGRVAYPANGTDPQERTRGLFTVHCTSGHRHRPPECAYVAVWYRDHWFYIDDRDQASKATLLLMLQLRRLDFRRQVIGGVPALTLPVGR